jgi:hypothetical protein
VTLAFNGLLPTGYETEPKEGATKLSLSFTTILERHVRIGKMLMI